MKKGLFHIVLLYASFVLPCAIKAQEVTWGEDPRSNSNNYYFKTIGENTSGIYMLSHSSRKQEITSFAIEQYNHNLFFKNKKSIRIRGQRLARLHIFENDVFFAMLPTQRKSGAQSVTGYLIDENLNEFSKTLPLLTLDVVSRSQDYFFKLKGSADNNFMGVLGFIDKQGGNGKEIFYKVYNAALDLIESKKFTLAFDFNEEDIGSIFIDNSHNFYFVLNHHINDSKAGSGKLVTELVYCNLNQSALVHIPITETSYRVREADFVQDDTLKMVFLTGFFGYEHNQFQKGVFQIGIDIEKGAITYNSFTDIPIDFVSDVVGQKNLERGNLLNNFYIKKVVRTTDNKSIVIAERYFPDTYYEQIWINGAPISISRKLYNYDEIIIMCIDTAGSICWNKVIHKKQSSQDDYGYFSSILIGVMPDYISIIYNDRMSKSRDVLEYKITKEGDITSEILLPAEELYTFIVPTEGRQIGYNRLVVPVLKEREYSLIKITYQNP
ncbi:MAG: hypothetical protein M0R38_05625 [Bacteroidia bacterium]|nr:hypothetical protein [Bacteroidia bacterium]